MLIIWAWVAFEEGRNRSLKRMTIFFWISCTLEMVEMLMASFIDSGIALASSSEILVLEGLVGFVLSAFHWGLGRALRFEFCNAFIEVRDGLLINVLEIFACLVYLGPGVSVDGDFSVELFNV